MHNPLSPGYFTEDELSQFGQLQVGAVLDRTFHRYPIAHSHSSFVSLFTYY